MAAGTRSGQDRSLQSFRERYSVGRGLDPSGNMAGRDKSLPYESHFPLLVGEAFMPPVGASHDCNIKNRRPIGAGTYIRGGKYHGSTRIL